jgi:hypothetical protein
MFRQILFCGAMLLAAVPLRGDETPLDEAVMETMEIVNESLGSNLGLRKADAVAADAGDLEALFAEVEAYFTRRGDAADAVGYAKKSREAMAGVREAAAKGDFEAAAGLASEVSRTCKACHRKYKPD